MARGCDGVEMTAGRPKDKGTRGDGAGGVELHRPSCIKRAELGEEMSARWVGRRRGSTAQRPLSFSLLSSLLILLLFSLSLSLSLSLLQIESSVAAVFLCL